MEGVRAYLVILHTVSLFWFCFCQIINDAVLYVMCCCSFEAVFKKKKKKQHLLKNYRFSFYYTPICKTEKLKNSVHLNYHYCIFRWVCSPLCHLTITNKGAEGREPGRKGSCGL